jgi:probable F420-dependent oxidoreductase
MSTSWPSSLQRLDGTVGIWSFASEALAPARAGEISQELESLGFGAFWFPEAWGREAFTNAGLQLSASSNIIVGTSIANIWGRDAIASTAAAKTLNAAYDDRFVLGLGVSHQPLVNGLRGHDYQSPLNAMRSYLEAMNAATSFAPEAKQPYAKLIAALGPKMLELAAQLADGVLPYLVTPEHTAIARAAVGDKFIGVEQAVVLGQTREEYLRRAHDHLATYSGLPNYRNSWKRLGFDESDFVRGGSERLCEAMVVHGDEAAVLARINEHRQAGANHVCLQVLGSDLSKIPYDDWRALGPVVNA